jgi:hypothetical protein
MSGLTPQWFLDWKCLPSIDTESGTMSILSLPFKFFWFLSKGSTACILTSKMANIWSNSKAILHIIYESDSDTESTFSGDNSNYEPENSENEDEESNKRDDDTSTVAG